VFFAKEKLKLRIDELNKYRYIDMQPIFPLMGKLGENGPTQVYEDAQIPEDISDFVVDKGFTVHGFNTYLWSRGMVKIPAKRENCRIAGCFLFGKGGNLSGMETQLYVDRIPYQGIDVNHQEVMFDELAAKEVELTFLSWSGLQGGEPLKNPPDVESSVLKAEIGYLYEPADELYYLLKAAHQTLRVLSEHDHQRFMLEKLVDDTLYILNWDEDKLLSTVPAALDCFLKGCENFKPLEGVVTDVVGHTHIDVAWLWRLKHTREKAMRSFSTVLRLMEEFDEYVFLQSQPQLYKFIKNDSPAIYEGIKKRVADGKWEADGGMWLEADCNISSGEALSRQFLHGINFLKEEFNVNCKYLWLPDVFGYSWALPQILKLCEIDTFATTKISWNQFNTMPHDLFSWRGIDGTDIMTLLLTSLSDPDDGQGTRDGMAFFADTTLEDSLKERGTTYNSTITAKTVLGSWMKFREKGFTQRALIPYGHGDGGGGVTRGMLKLRRALEKMPSIPKANPSKAGDFFDKVHADVSASGQQLPVWDGELYLEYHRGTYTTQAHNKKMNRKCEFGLAQAEWIGTLVNLLGGNVDTDALKEGWETVLRNQFHDIIPGSSIHEVYEDSRAEYQGVCDMLDKFNDDAYNTLTVQKDGAYTLTNFSSFDRFEPVYIETDALGTFTDREGMPLVSQRTEKGYYVLCQVPALSMATIYFTEGSGESYEPIDEEVDEYEDDLYIIAFDDDGAISRLYDKTAEREVIKAGGVGNALEVYEDKSMKYDAWDIDIYYTQKKERFKMVGVPRVIECGELITRIRTQYAYNLSTISQDMVIYAHSGRIDFVTHANWHESHRLLKASFSADIRATRANYDIQYGYADRPTHKNTSWDWAKFEVCAHKWADISEQNYGAAILSESKYGFNIHESEMKISLLRSPKAPDYEADMGEHDFTYSFLPHEGSAADGGVIEEATALNLPISVRKGEDVLSGRRVIVIDSDDIGIDAIKAGYSENCVILRVHELRGGARKATITSDFSFKAYKPCNIIENDIGELVKSDTIEAAFRPFEIKTYKLYF